MHIWLRVKGLVYFDVYSFILAPFVCRVGVDTSQPTVTMEVQPGQDNMVPLTLNAGDSQQHQALQLSSSSPPLTLSQVQLCTLSWSGLPKNQSCKLLMK